MKKKETFIELCIQNKCSMDDVDDFIEIWHNSDESCDLHSFLGMTNEDYALFLHDSRSLNSIIEKYKENK